MLREEERLGGGRGGYLDAESKRMEARCSGVRRKWSAPPSRWTVISIPREVSLKSTEVTLGFSLAEYGSMMAANLVSEALRERKRSGMRSLAEAPGPSPVVSVVPGEPAARSWTWTFLPGKVVATGWRIWAAAAF